jgi:hypothetical protein
MSSPNKKPFSKNKLSTYLQEMLAQTLFEVRAAILAHQHYGLPGQESVDQLKKTGIFSSKITVNCQLHR